MSYQSVTQILQEEGFSENLSWLDPVYRFRGTAVHTGARMIDAGQVPTLKWPKHYEKVAREILDGFWPAFATWKERTGFVGRIWECRFVDEELGYSGQFDAVGEMPDDDAAILIDVKTGQCPKMVPLQLAAYECLIRRGKPLDPNHEGLDWLQGVVASGRPFKRRVVNLKKDGTERTLERTPTQRDSYDDPCWVEAWQGIVRLRHLRSKYNLSPPLDKKQNSL